MSDDSSVGALQFDWSPLPKHPRLAGGVVHLVCSRVPDGFLYDEQCHVILNEPERLRASKFRFDHHRNRWVAGRVTLKRLLCRYLDCDISSLALGVGEIGKPFVARPESDLCFNYTDSEGFLIYAFAKALEVGVDLEYLPRKTNYQGLASRKLSAQEQQAFGILPETSQELGFLASWTRKEAYGKALGVGIRYPMESVTLCTDYADPYFSTAGYTDTPVSLYQVSPPFNGIACVAGIGGAFEISPYIL